MPVAHSRRTGEDSGPCRSNRRARFMAVVRPSRSDSCEPAPPAVPITQASTGEKAPRLRSATAPCPMPMAPVQEHPIAAARVLCQFCP
jgi:hypothetical protein